MTTEFRVLGPTEVVVDGRAVDVGHARPRAVLAVLLAEANRVVTVNQLVDRVWGVESAPDDPRGALRTYVSLLRRALAPAEGVALVRRSPGYTAADRLPSVINHDTDSINRQLGGRSVCRRPAR